MKFVNALKTLALSAMLLAGFTACQQDELAPVTADQQEIDLRAHSTVVLWASTNTDGQIGMYEVGAVPDVNEATIGVSYADADGIYYDENFGALYHVDRSNDVLRLYGMPDQWEDGDFATPTATSSPGHFTMGREMAFTLGRVIVADDADPSNNNQNRFVLYRASNNGLRYYRTINTTINLWGIQLIGDDLYAVVDNSSDLAVFYNIFNNSNNSTISPDKRVTIAGIGRTHGISYEGDVMVMTNIGDAASATDGGLHIIDNFWSKFAATPNGGVIPTSDQAIISGSNTLLGNPVDVAYSYSNGKIHVAERANGGGRILIFDKPESTGMYNWAPIYDDLFPGASAVDIEE